MNLPELLAPAGNMECLHAAVSAGANAVYLGLDTFNARRNADNFTTESLRDACEYAHLRGVSIYVTLNIEILPGELEEALACARDAFEAGADALIVQDIGLAAEIKRTLPEARIHASTQMNIHNAAGVVAAAQMGVSRVTMARELSIDELAELSGIAADYGMDIECFAHGALCICYSGQCLMSSMIGGRSANRGLCAQACRLPYELHRDDVDGALPAEGEHLLSPRDLCTIGLLGELRRAGVASLKIEGRMKSADYVHEVVSVYREALDELARCEDAVRADAVERREARLAEAFSRGFTSAYLEGKRGNDIMSYSRPNNRGVFIGRVTRVDDGYAEIAPELELHEGDIVEFWTNRGQFRVTLTPEARVSGKTAYIPIDQRTSKGDRVFRVRNAAAAYTYDEFAPRVPVAGYATLAVGKPAHIRFVSESGEQGEAWGADVEPARTKALEEPDVRAHIDRLGQTPFVLDELHVNLEGNPGMGFSQLHHLRAQALDDLRRAMLASYETKTRKAVESRLESAAGYAAPAHVAPSPSPDKGKAGARCEVVGWATNPGCARAAKRGGASSIFVPVLNFRRGQAQVCGVRQDAAEQAGYPKQCLMALPAIDHDPVRGTREYALSFDPWDYVREGKTVFADSLAGAVRALEMGASVEIGPHVPITNEASLKYVASLGVGRVWLSPELTLGQIAALAERSPVKLGLFVSGVQELMICEHCLLMSQGACAEDCERCPRREVAHKLVDRKGFDFPIVTDALGRSHLYNGIELDAASAIPDFVDMGISAFLVDTTFMDKKAAESAVRRIVRALEIATTSQGGVERRPGTTTGHLFRGVS